MQFLRQVICRLSLSYSVKFSFLNFQFSICNGLFYPLPLHYSTRYSCFVKCGNATYKEQAVFKGLNCRDLRIIVSS